MRRKADFRRLYDHGQVLRSSTVVMIFEETEAPGFLGAVVASRKVGSAVRRNRAKRWLREAHRTARGRTSLSGIRLILIARYTTPHAGFAKIRDEVARLYKDAGIIEHS